MQRIEKLDSITYDQFVENYIKPGLPVVLKNASASWKTNRELGPDFFREHFGQHTTTHKDKVYSMSEILDITEKSTFEKPAPYPISFEIRSKLPELLAILHPIHMNYAFPNWFMSRLLPYGRYGNDMHIYIGGAGNQYALHKDLYHTNAWITQLYGEKEFIAFPRDQEDLLYAEGISTRSPINILKPDYEKYPKYKQATPLRVVLQPGETIYIPNGIWHTTVASGHNISLVLEQLNSNNYKAWKKDIYDYGIKKNKAKAIIQYSFANVVGSLCKLNEVAGNKFY